MKTSCTFGLFPHKTLAMSHLETLHYTQLQSGFKMEKEQIIITSANQSDLPEIRNLVVTLAIFEKEPDAVVTTLQEYEEGLANQDFYIYKASYNGTIVGMALYYYIFSTWKGRTLYLEDFVVNPDLRSKGIGKLLFNKVVEKAKEEKCRQMKWQVLDWNKRAIKFYKAAGANIDQSWYNGYFNFEK